jgi:hypothetical protein
MESLLSKISAYHLISYALTGLIVTSSYIVLHGISPNFGPAVTFGAVYLIGLLISRIGSVLMEWPLKKVGFIKYAAYPEFVEAEGIDSKISGLAEQSSFYRTLCCGFGLAAAFSALDGREPEIAEIPGTAETIGLALASLLFLFAYRKQSKFVVDRVATQIRLKRQT